MRDFRDAKAMARTLRASLTAKTVSISHGESLELVSRMLGVADWNTLSAEIQASRDGSLAAATTHATEAGRHPAMPIRDFVPFPGEIAPLYTRSTKAIQALARAFQGARPIVVAIQRSADIDEPGLGDIYDVGVLGSVLTLDQLADGRWKALTQIHRRTMIKDFVGEADSYVAEVDDLDEQPAPDVPYLILSIKAYFMAHSFRDAIKRGYPREPQIKPPFERVRDAGRLADMIASHIELSIPYKQALLATLDPVRRLERVGAFLQGNA
ncbi:LON peptidase substrate-binding domain-containing protein [Bradyrhizobium sp.]|nr:LON peptidase substrate-binding domain-containing protein [Bradyrhizobium sp.]MCA3567233.1 LON peptidase substrate-binding domain-containing protein [Bradyrhizobium sp.]